MAIDLIKIINKHPDVNPELMNEDLYMDASCIGHLLRQDILIKIGL